MQRVIEIAVGWHGPDVAVPGGPVSPTDLRAYEIHAMEDERSWVARRIAFWCALCCVVPAGCSCPTAGTSDHRYELDVSLPGRQPNGITWNGESHWQSPACFDVLFPGGGVTLRADELIEVYSDTTRVALPRAVYYGVPPDDHSCPADIVRYDLSVLNTGTYQLVHRRAAAPAGWHSAYATPEWTVFAGEEALVTTVVVTELADGGAPDGG